MNGLVASKGGATERVPAGFEEKLVWLCRFGQPAVRNMGDGWFAKVEMHVSAQGASFDIKSDFSMQTPAAAVEQLIERMLEALARLTTA